jgi:hypothetical protein
MQLLVLSQVIDSCEHLIARLADMRPLYLMLQHVPSQVAGRREGLTARLADMRPLYLMRQYVPMQGLG